MKKRKADQVRTRPLAVRRAHVRSLDDVLDEMAAKWALRAERVQHKTLVKAKG